MNYKHLSKEERSCIRSIELYGESAERGREFLFKLSSHVDALKIP